MAAKITVMRPNATRYAPRDPPASCGNSELHHGEAEHALVGERGIRMGSASGTATVGRASGGPRTLRRMTRREPRPLQYGQTVVRNEVGAASLLRLVIGS